MLALLAGCIKVQLAEPAVVQEQESGPSYTGPAVDFTWSPLEPAPGRAVTFEPSVKVLKGQGVRSFEWSFGDGEGSAGERAQHAYLSPGGPPRRRAEPARRLAAAASALRAP